MNDPIDGPPVDAPLMGAPNLMVSLVFAEAEARFRTMTPRKRAAYIASLYEQAETLERLGSVIRIRTSSPLPPREMSALRNETAAHLRALADLLSRALVRSMTAK